MCKTELVWVTELLNKNPEVFQFKKVFKFSFKIDLIIILVHLRRKYGVTQIESVTDKIISKFINTVIKHKDLSSKDKNKMSEEDKSFMLEINQLFDKYRGGINGSNKYRFEKWISIISEFLPKNSLDKKRVATREEKEIIWWKQDKKCAICGEECTIDESECDHILEYKLGGSSKIEDENLQIVHKDCHKEKTRVFMKEKNFV